MNDRLLGTCYPCAPKLGAQKREATNGAARAATMHARRAMVTHAVALGVHAVDSSRELVLHAAMPPSTFICFPSFFFAEMPLRGPLELWLQHADCGTPVTGAEVEVVSSGKVFMT